MLDRAVVNAGPVVALSLLDQLDLLPALFTECWVPQMDFNEVVAGIGKPGAKSLQAADWQGRGGWVRSQTHYWLWNWTPARPRS
jgi:hypothetical protein